MRIYPECERCAHRESDINGACGICTKTAPSQFLKRIEVLDLKDEIFPDEQTKDPCTECGEHVVFRNVYGEWKCISCGITRHAPDEEKT